MGSCLSSRTRKTHLYLPACGTQRVVDSVCLDPILETCDLYLDVMLKSRNL